ncbi:uncharacterized protein TRIVIDRAFT_60146 [Trichoderma virens Gv29-8]|uniref:Uncharacterized protein n=1 Tax=Hypocrea virens (strain Gv29-8 / FGSC 10586) TaxID=413071 RepID=G9MST7_HYPVG|nr:uncharacterized protein TRIVIDRAFT_60146 [Trichoderma virens Gv29-8]EHK23192.1 hypothetical protein TRIVIDRAFT_60146 [Trichoderma virens Gv29-8]UKZ48093.1 hypothetical protein TrVGV298_002329 [Trichoderma virens]
MTSMVQFARLAFVVVLVFLGQALDAANLETKHDTNRPLKVRLDYALATRSNDVAENRHQWVFSSHITFKENVEVITDGQLLRMAGDAFAEMEADFLQYAPYLDKNGKPKMLPGAMSILAAGNEIFLSSSQKGLSTFINEVADSPVKRQLEVCFATWKLEHPDKDETDHKNNRRCGEIMTFHQYYKVHSEELITLSPLARLTTVVRLARTGEMVLIPACGTGLEDRWGCDYFLKDHKAPPEKSDVVKYLDDKTLVAEEYTLDALAGGVRNIDQIESC